MALNNYITEVQELLHDPNATYFPTADLTNYINRARNRIAGGSQSIRVLLSGGTITAIAINSGGSGYSGTASVAISGAGQQATASATISGGAVNSITLTNGGWGYITGTTTTVTVTGSTGGSNATFTLTIDNSVTTVANQEVYQWKTANVLAAAQILVPGVLQVMGVFTVAGAWGANAAMKPVLYEEIWSEFQAKYRSYNTGLQSFPTVFSKYGQGANGSIYLWTIPSQAMQMDWDAWCLPVVLTDDNTPEALPYPWTAPVAFYAAYLALLGNAQRKDDAATMKQEYQEKMLEAVTMSNAPFVRNYYEDDF